LRSIPIGNIAVGVDNPLVLIAGPCVIEDESTTVAIARELVEITRRLNQPLIFKASYDKANRTSGRSYRGPGLAAGLDLLDFIRNRFQVPVLSDVHRVEEVGPAAEVLDVLQVPAFLCRQTDLLEAVGRSGRVVNIKKGQFLAPGDMGPAVEKVVETGNRDILLTERGTTFGYHNLVVDFRSLPIMAGLGFPVIFDATHSVQLPGGGAGVSAGEREFVPCLARAAVAAGVQGIFMEVHLEPDRALCDGPNSWPLERLEPLIRSWQALQRSLKESD
jgi:2-dehydro-3-deoxyphosphooctonate aldolase (KDO 8-P synthase)